ncbi:hypothetical protein Syun_012779 [Stephania yunnanensis]|uniref:Chlororespiratory reduction 4 n=1 Tax=Stephania yunnanensis TaxID=152371 RepID=A0AAP0PHW2_9MAGN
MVTCAHPWSSNLPTTTLHLIKTCKTQRDIDQIHARLISTGLIKNPSLAAKITLHLCGSNHPPLAQFARFLFFHQFISQSPHLHIFIWNALIKSFSHGDRPAQALLLFHFMLCRGVCADKFSLSLVLKASSRLGLLREGMQVHGLMEKVEFGSDVVLRNSLIGLYLKCGCLEFARLVFDKMPARDSVSWNAMIDGYSKMGMMGLAGDLFGKMPGWARNAVSWNSMVGGFARSRSEDGLEVAWGLFDEMPERDVVSWNCMIDGCVKCGRIEAAKYLFDRMPERDAVTWASMIDGYMKFGKIGEARSLFDGMPETKRDVVTWNAMLAGYVQSGECFEALQLFHDFIYRSDLVPDHATLVIALSAVAELGRIDEGTSIHQYIERNGLHFDGNLGVALIDMYSKCGSIENALSVFENLEQKSVHHWNAMIGGLAIHGLGELALELFIEMEGLSIEPDDITFIAILNACGHAGLVKEGLICFELMRRVHGLKPKLQHYGCLVDILGRAGQLEVAKKLIEEMPMSPNDVVWRSLLSACQNHGNLKMGVWVAEHLMKMDTINSSSYILLSNIYAGFGVWDNVSRIRCRMKERGVKKIPGCSWIEVKGTVHEFFVGDFTHPQHREIHSVLISLCKHLSHKSFTVT